MRSNPGFRGTLLRPRSWCRPETTSSSRRCPPRGIKGRVRYPDGTPAAYVRVIAKPEDHAALDVEIVSDEDGKFLLEGLLPGSWSLHAWTEEGEEDFTATTLGVRPGATDVRMRLSLAPEGE